MKHIYRYILVFLSIFLITLSAVSAFANGDSPRFNFLNGDYKTLRGANLTAGEKNWHNPVSAKIGDTVNWNIYLHNGVEGTTAQNVKVRVNLPQNQALSHTLNAEITADDIAAVLDNAELNLDAAGKIEYLSGSTELYDRNGKKVKNLPDGITNTGINLGEIKGCWPYAVFVVFQTKITQTKIGSVDIFKTVRNLAKNETFAHSTVANVKENLEYQILIENNTNQRVDFYLIDALPDYVNYIQDSLVAEFNNQKVTIYNPAEELFNTYKALHLESGKTLKLTFQVDIKDSTFIGTIFTNTATLSTEDQTKSASAVVTIIPGPVLGKVGEVLGATTLPVTGNPITVALALAFLSTSIYYTLREKQLFNLELKRVRVLN